MDILYLASAEPVELEYEGEGVATDTVTGDLAALVPADAACVAIRFARFSDGRGFTLARHLRDALAYRGAVLACGHLIPDQAVYLHRCGFSHVEIAPESLAQWQRSLSLSAPPMQQVLASRRARDHRMATS